MSKSIRITSCSDPAYWYKGKEGESFFLLFEDREEYVVIGSRGYVNIVKLGDGVVESSGGEGDE